jgi:TorA maturation chaperone TorD
MKPRIHSKAPDFADFTALERSSIYRLLSFLYRRAPTADLVRHIRRPEVFAILAEAGMALDENEWLADSPAEIAEKLAVDYTALFIAGNNCTPLNESIHRGGSGTYWGDSTVEVKTFIESLGIRINDNWDGLHDHLSVEFEIMMILAEQEGIVLKDGDSDTVETCKELQTSFFTSHLARWVPSLCDGIASRATTSFYRELARTTQLFMVQESQMLGHP